MVNDVFIIMPFGEQVLRTADGDRTYSAAHFDDVYQVLLDAVRSFRATIEVGRMDRKHGNLVNAIIHRLARADVVIAVLAGKNPNVFWELGVRHGLRRGTIMLVERRDEYPFDLHSYFSHQYSIDHHEDRESLKAFVKERLQELDAEPLDDSPVLDVLRKSEIEQFRLLNEWETRRAILVIGGLLAEAWAVHSMILQMLKSVEHLVRKAPDASLQPLDEQQPLVESFIASRPLVGLPQSAYIDASSLYSTMKVFSCMWNSSVQSVENNELTPEEFYERAFEAIAHLDRDLTGFQFDLIHVAEHVMTHKIAAGLPWGRSMGKARSLIDKLSVLDKSRAAVLRRSNDIQNQLYSFEASFTGIPPYVLVDKRFAFVYCEDGLLKNTERFADFVRQHADAIVGTDEPGTDDAEGTTKH
jgi:hypothetical protein